MATTTLIAEWPETRTSGDIVILENSQVRLEFDLSSGTYSILKQEQSQPVIADSVLKINQWSSDLGDAKRTWLKRSVEDSLGKGLALEITVKPEHGPELLFSFMLYEKLNFFSATAGIRNTTDEVVRVKDIHIVTDASLYPKSKGFEDFAMIDGFSGGEPLEYGERFYSPLSRANAMKSRNNIFLTFSQNGKREQLVMGGLSYHDFEKFAWIEQARRNELSCGIDLYPSLICYLDLPDEKTDHGKEGEVLRLAYGSKPRRWENHEFRCSEMAVSVEEEERIVIEAQNLKKDRPYILGFSWWHGMRHGRHQDLTQSVFVEFEQGNETKRLALIENRKLPRFDRESKKDIEQVELILPIEAIAAGNFRILVEKAEGTEEENRNVYLSEIWLRDGRHKALIPAVLTPVAESVRPRRSYTGQLFASDPVGKRVDQGQTYIARDQFYIDVTGSDPFLALEAYASNVRKAQNIKLSMYDFPTVCLWYAADKRYGGIGSGGADNTSLGAVEEAQDIADSGFLNYSRVAVRLVPDSYMPNNHQGWWDDKHWQREDTDRDTTQNGRYIEPYETTRKWGRAVRDLGVIPLTYFQTAYRSEDYAKQFPEHMLFNKRYAWKGEPVDTEGEMFTTWQKTWVRNGRVVWGYDFTDPSFLKHLQEVYNNLKDGGLKGLMFDYPASGWARAGGMEDDYSTTAAAYRTIFRLPHEILGPESYVHERNMERGTDVSLGVVASMRTENDTDSMDGATVTRCGLRWYKNRVLVNFDTDSKNLLELADNRDHIRAVLTMCYVTTGRLLLANSFGQFSQQNLRDLSRCFPYHRTAKSARPVDAFVSKIPMVYSYEVTPEWHQVTFYNPDKENRKQIGINLSGEQVDGALGLDADTAYHLYDFWNDRYLGALKGDQRLLQTLRPGEARMMSVRKIKKHPQVISTDRHIMQGYLDLKDERWDGETRTLSGISKIVGNDPYRVVLTTTGRKITSVSTNHAPGVEHKIISHDNDIHELVLQGSKNTEVTWAVRFDSN
ncbi:MAG: hypothetical protein ACPGSB_01625 [Opitutales bacterium]